MAKSRSLRSLHSQEVISRKIKKVAHEHPNLSHKAVVGRALGILSHNKKKKKRGG